jgi:hypothetical protein
MAQTLLFLNEDTTFGAVCGEAFDTGAAVGIKSADGLLYKAGAAASTAGLVPCLGFAETVGEIGKSVAVKTQGIMEWITATLTEGAYVYLGETLGTIQVAAPSGGGKRVQILGVAIDTSRFVIQIEPYTTL